MTIEQPDIPEDPVKELAKSTERLEKLNELLRSKREMDKLRDTLSI